MKTERSNKPPCCPVCRRSFTMMRAALAVAYVPYDGSSPQWYAVCDNCKPRLTKDDLVIRRIEKRLASKPWKYEIAPPPAEEVKPVTDLAELEQQHQKETQP